MNLLGPTIAIVDDDENVRRALRRMITSLSYRVVEFASGNAFFAELETGAFACVLLDLHMPGMNGIDVLARLRGDGYAIPAIIITGGDEPKMRMRCLAAGASDYLIKPIGREATHQAIQSLVALHKSQQQSSIDPQTGIDRQTS